MITKPLKTFKLLLNWKTSSDAIVLIWYMSSSVTNVRRNILERQGKGKLTKRQSQSASPTHSATTIPTILKVEGHLEVCARWISDIFFAANTFTIYKFRTKLWIQVSAKVQNKTNYIIIRNLRQKCLQDYKNEFWCINNITRKVIIKCISNVIHCFY